MNDINARLLSHFVSSLSFHSWGIAKLALTTMYTDIIRAIDREKIMVETQKNF